MDSISGASRPNEAKCQRKQPTLESLTRRRQRTFFDMSLMLEEFIEKLSASYTSFADSQDAEISACFCLVLDHWERVSAQHGYGGLLKLLKTFLARIEDDLDVEIVMARLSERSLVGLIPPGSKQSPKERLTRLFERVTGSTFEVGGDSLAISVTLAWANFDLRFTSADNLLLSLTRTAKQLSATGGNRIVHIQAEMTAEQASGSNRRMLALLLESLRTNSLKVLFQPVMSTAAEPTQSFQALPRLVASDGSLIPAAKFVPAAREAGILATLDRWMLTHCIKMLAKDYQQIPIRIFLTQGDYLIQLPERREWLERLAAKNELASAKLALDFSLSDFLSQVMGAHELFALLRQFGMEVCVSNVDERSRWDLLVKEFPVDFVKMSPSFVRRLAHEEILESEFVRVSAPARERGVKIIMPMVEDAGLAANLWHLGADYMQGFMIQEAQEQIDLAD